MRALILLCMANAAFGFRILGFFPFPAKSHHQTFAPIMLELARRGHHVVYLTSVKPDFSHPNVDVREITNFKHKYLELLNLNALGAAAIALQSHMFSRAAIAVSEEFYGQPEAQKIIHGNDSFDAVLIESHFTQEPASALLHKFGCVAIEVGSISDTTWLNEMAGLPDNAAYQADFKTAHSDSMAVFERLHNLYATWSSILVSYYHLWNMQSVMDKYFNYTGWESRPPINKLISNRSMILVNRDVVLGYPYPKAPHMKDIGGVNVVPNKPLPKDIQDFMDTASSGVIYFSLGSNLNTSDVASGQFGEAFMTVFRSLPQRVLLKWENNKPYRFPTNVKTGQWLPQQDILAHKNCVLFITHGGYNSLVESVFHGVPVIGIPFFGDQPKNLKQVETAGFGINLQYGNVSRESVSWAVGEILNNPRYKDEVMKRSRIMREKRPAIEEAVHWVEFAIKYPNSLTPRAAFLSFFQIYMIDLKLIIFASIIGIYKLLSSLMLLFPRRKSPKKHKRS